MFRRIGCFLGAFVIGISPVFAAATCPDGSQRNDKEIARLIDLYAQAPFSARTWRVLKGLGDPGIDEGYSGQSSWDNQDKWRKRLTELAPDIKQPSYYGGECRLDYPFQVLEKRLADLGPKHPYLRHWLTVQTAILSACDDKSVTELPPPLASLEGDKKALQDADRAYQQATLVFYQDKAKAVDLFRAIGKSSS